MLTPTIISAPIMQLYERWPSDVQAEVDALYTTKRLTKYQAYWFTESDYATYPAIYSYILARGFMRVVISKRAAIEWFESEALNGAA